MGPQKMSCSSGVLTSGCPNRRAPLSPLYIFLRVKFREDYSGLVLLVNIIDSIVFGHNVPAEGQEVVTMENGDRKLVAMETKKVVSDKEREQVSPSQAMGNSDCQPSRDTEGSDKYLLPLPPLRESINILLAPLSEERLGWISEAMKVVFNQTVHWKEEGQFSEVGYKVVR